MRKWHKHKHLSAPPSFLSEEKMLSGASASAPEACPIRTVSRGEEQNRPFLFLSVISVNASRNIFAVFCSPPRQNRPSARCQANPARWLGSPMKIGFSEQLHRKIIFSGGWERIRRPFDRLRDHRDRDARSVPGITKRRVGDGFAGPSTGSGTVTGGNGEKAAGVAHKKEVDC